MIPSSSYIALSVVFSTTRITSKTRPVAVEIYRGTPPPNDPKSKQVVDSYLFGDSANPS